MSKKSSHKYWKFYLKSIILLTIIFVVFISCTPAVISSKKTIKDKKLNNNDSLINSANIEKKKFTPKKKIKESYVKYKYLDNIKNDEPVRVGIIEGYKKVIFKLYGNYILRNSRGKRIFSIQDSKEKWKVIISGSKIVLGNEKKKAIIELDQKVILIPESKNSYIEISSVKVGKGWSWQKKKTRKYRGGFEFVKIGKSITAVNVVSIDNYVYGVVPYEMSSKSPLEALKAQAILARTNAFSTIGQKYRGKPYSITADVFTQVYGGISNETYLTNKAVDETKGLILVHNNKPIEAVFHSVCGGYIERNDMVWSGKKKEYLSEHPDIPISDIKLRNKFSNLSNESIFKNWIQSSPACYCNMDARKGFAPALKYAKKYFRWEKKYKRKDLEKIIKRKSGKDIGTLKNIIITKRGKSGKARTIKIIGTKRNINITKELNIRKTLSKNYLYSANFYVEKRGVNKNGIASTFIFKGAGFGHGAGMCQIGAVGMALDGNDFEDILKFYFDKTEIKNIVSR